MRAFIDHEHGRIRILRFDVRRDQADGDAGRTDKDQEIILREMLPDPHTQRLVKRSLLQLFCKSGHADRNSGKFRAEPLDFRGRFPAFQCKTQNK